MDRQRKPIDSLEGLIEALDEILDVYGDMPTEAAMKHYRFPFKIVGVWMTNDNSTRDNPSGCVL